MKGHAICRRWGRAAARTVIAAVILLLSAPMVLLCGAGSVSAQTVVKTVKVGECPRAVGINSKTGKKYVVDYCDDAVSVLGGDDTVIKTFAVGGNPRSVAVNEKLNRIYVTNWLDDTVSVIDGNADGVVKTVGVGIKPFRVAANPNTHKVYVANSAENTVSVINGMTDTVSKTIPVGDYPAGIAVNPRTNMVYAANYDGKSISVIDGKSDSVVETVALLGRGYSVGVNPETNLVYAAGEIDVGKEGMVWVIDGETNAVRSAIEVSYSPVINMAVNPATNRIYACSSEENELSIINGASGVLRTTVGVGLYPESVGVDPRTDKVYVPNGDDDTVSIVHDPPGDSFYFAEGTTRPGFDPYICVQNTGEDEAEVTVTYMPGQGDPKEQQLKIPPRSRATVHPADVLGTGDDPSHDFSAKVECTNGQRIVAERPTYFNYKGAWAGGHNVMGATGPNYEAYFAEATTRPGFEPYVCVQNPSYEGTHVRLWLGTVSREVPVAPRSRATVSYLEMEEAGPDFSISLMTIPSRAGYGQKFIAERPMYFNYNGLWAGGSDVVGTPSPGQTFYFAEGTTRPGFDSYICIWAQGYPTRVRITYMLGDGTTKEQEVEFGGRTTINCRDVLGTGDDASHDFSARVESLNGEPIVAERPMYFNYKGTWAGGHDVIGASSPSRAFYFAEGCARPGFHTYFCIQNPQDKAADVKITYMKGDGTTSEQNLQVKSHSRSTVACHDFLGNVDDEAHDFSAKVECTNGGQIIVERPTYFNYRGVWAGGHNVMGYQE